MSGRYDPSAPKQPIQSFWFTFSPCHASRGIQRIYRPLGYERVDLSLYKLADTPFHIQGDDISFKTIPWSHSAWLLMVVNEAPVQPVLAAKVE